MVAPLAMKVREAIVHAHEELGLSYWAVSAKLRVCESTVARVLRRKRALGSVAPLPIGGGNSSPLRAVEDVLLAIIEERPDAMITEITAELIARTGIQTSGASVKRALQRLDLTRKKVLHGERARYARTPGAAQAIRGAPLADSRRSTHFSRRIVLPHGDAPGLRMVAARATSLWRAACAHLEDPDADRGDSSRREAAACNVRRLGERGGVPRVREASFVSIRAPGRPVVMDNLGAHKTKPVQEAIEALGATPVYLSTYSPELNPIELSWAHIRRSLRSLAVDAREELAKAVRMLPARTSVDHVSAWFRCALTHSQSN